MPKKMNWFGHSVYILLLLSALVHLILGITGFANNPVDIVAGIFGRWAFLKNLIYVIVGGVGLIGGGIYYIILCMKRN